MKHSERELIKLQRRQRQMMEHESESPPSRIMVNDDIDKSDDCESMNSLLTHRWQQQPIANIRITRDDEMMSALSPADEEQVVDDAAAEVVVESCDRPSQKHRADVELTTDGAEAEAQVAEETLLACSTSASKREIINTATSSSSRRRRKSRKRNISSSSHDLIFAMVALLLCTSSLHQSVLAVKITDDADTTRSNDGNGNGIQRKRGGGGAKRESLQEQFQRITNHRRLDRQHHEQHQQGRQQLVANGPPLSSHSRTLQGDTMVCTCSPQIFNIKITLTSTDPCTTDD
eukprot:CAMPEP_0113418974 /NCGR_PEP_ID=MMETSP0013_2-20120614/26511_1 /TAXON_ID=2843 ORGANISM="Skeletonema costatum, Strain 1716" /NCGR_SAMPLE_ID=MMETSP0013_2 /ASSEMBLY_ACC=CAM_ASM_000158 /LENGTH=288 /DNA_ID=CAMNT_0000306283 /DNA_START=204 /DNA_END=1067 /DNA_ORIENTATION=- /assembly_acc=CAM_ASM_000158